MVAHKFIVAFILLTFLSALVFVLGCGKTGAGTTQHTNNNIIDVPSSPGSPEGDIKSIPQKIVPKNRCIYHGAFLGDAPISLSSINNFENMSGKKLDIVLKFLAFSSMGSNSGGFPIEEAKVVTDNGSVLFIKLEPWSYAGSTDKSFPLSDIISGKYDSRLVNFAIQVAKFNKPIFITFGHEMNASWYPWCGNPELYKQSYIHVYNTIEKYASNVTWVWNPNVEGENFANYYPGNSYVDWVAVDGYNTEDYGSTWKNAEQIFNASLTQLEYYNKPIMIGEMACDANSNFDEDIKKPDWLYNAIGWIISKNKNTLSSSDESDNLIKAYIYFNFDKVEDGKLKKWAISTINAQTKYKEVLTIFADFYKGLEFK